MWTALAAAAAVILLALRFLTAGGGGSSGPGGEGPPKQVTGVQVEVVHPARVGGTVSAVGTVLSNEEIQVRSQVSGQVEQILFTEGARVKKGDVLLRVNDDELQAQLLRARSRVAIAEQQAERQKQLFGKDFISREEYNNALNELNVVRAEAQLIEVQIQKTEITAPFDGTIGLRLVSEGSYVSPSLVITTLQDNSRMKIDFSVPEKYAQMIGEGDSITFRVQTRPETFSARIYSSDSRIDATTRTLRLRAACANPGGALLAGSFANVDVRVNPRASLTIPAYALIPEMRGHKVYLCRDGVAVPQPVSIGQRTDERVEILDGLTDGDTVITSAILQLRPGMAVEPLPARAEETP